MRFDFDLYAISIVRIFYFFFFLFALWPKAISVVIPCLFDAAFQSNWLICLRLKTAKTENKTLLARSPFITFVWCFPLSTWRCILRFVFFFFLFILIIVLLEHCWRKRLCVPLWMFCLYISVRRSLVTWLTKLPMRPNRLEDFHWMCLGRFLLLLFCPIKVENEKKKTEVMKTNRRIEINRFQRRKLNSHLN